MCPAELEDKGDESQGGTDQGDGDNGGTQGEAMGMRRRKAGATGYLDPNGTLADADSLRAKVRAL